MKSLLDHNLDHRLKNFLTEYETATTQEQGWADALNGEYVRVIDEKDETAIYTKNFFLPLQLPSEIINALSKAYSHIN